MAREESAERLPARSPHSSTDVFGRSGGMSDLARSVEWGNTPVGDVGSWSQSLRTAVSLVLESKSAMMLAWGPGFTQFYNDAFRPILGTMKHPRAMGQG